MPIRSSAPQTIEKQKPDPRQELADKTGKLVVDWEPRTNSDIYIELEGCIIYGIPEYADQIGDPQSRLTHCVLGELLSMKEKLDSLNRKITAAERAGRALAAKEQATIQAMTNGANAPVSDQAKTPNDSKDE